MTQRTVLITGAGGGMCRGINRRLAAAGYRLVLVDLSFDAVERARADLGDAGSQAHVFAADLTDEAELARLVEAVAAEVGPVDALVNAAGILDRLTLETCTVADFRRTIEVNLIAPYAMIHTFAPGMVERGWGRIVNISSIAGLTGYPYPSYAASKAGIANLTRALVVDLKGTGVTINAINPGVVDTPMVIQSVRDAVAAKVPTETVIEPEEIGAMVAHLMTDDARNINGANLLIDGGAISYFQLIDPRG